MPASNLLALIDDIATLLDDVAVLSKVAVKKTAGVVGDDLALNANQVTGISADRELPVVWAVAKGSLLNKAILVPAALAISWAAPWAIPPLLMVGGTYLCYEGCEKLAHKFLHKTESEAHRQDFIKAVADPAVDLVQYEKIKIKGAIRTDFILSAEIVVISLGMVKEAQWLARVTTLTAVAFFMTVAVYGLVAGIVKIDDLGRYWNESRSSWKRWLGSFLLLAAPYLMKALSVAGTAAMFLVGGGILAHGLPFLHGLAKATGPLPLLGEMAVGLVGGSLALAAVQIFGRFRRKAAPNHSPRTADSKHK